MARLRAEKDEVTQTLVRRQADFENYRKRIERERQEEHRRGVGPASEELIPVLDSFERALKAHDNPAFEEYRKGLEMTYRQMWDILARHGLERIAAAGKQFDPHWHQAIDRVESTEILTERSWRFYRRATFITGASCGPASCGSRFPDRVEQRSVIRSAPYRKLTLEETKSIPLASISNPVAQHNKRDYYEILEVTRTATQEEVKSAYRKAALSGIRTAT